jgi:hypothetical protein
MDAERTEQSQNGDNEISKVNEYVPKVASKLIFMKNPISTLEIPIMTGGSMVNPMQNVELRNWTFDVKSQHYDITTGTFINIDELGDCEVLFTGNFETSVETFIDELINVPTLELYDEETLDTITSVRFPIQVNVQMLHNKMCTNKYSLLMCGQINLRAFILKNSKHKHIGLRMNNNGLVIPSIDSLQMIGSQSRSASIIRFVANSIFSIKPI